MKTMTANHALNRTRRYAASCSATSVAARRLAWYRIQGYMDSSTEQAPSIRVFRRLTIALWACVLVLLLNTALQVFTQFLPFMYARQFLADPQGISSHRAFPSLDPLADFYQWPLEKRVQNASVIALTKFTQEVRESRPTIAGDLESSAGYNIQLSCWRRIRARQPVRAGEHYLW